MVTSSSSSVFSRPLPLQFLQSSGITEIGNIGWPSSTSFGPHQLHLRFPSSLSSKGLRDAGGVRNLKAYGSKGKGFGELLKSSRREASGDKAGPNVCPCGGGDEGKEYGSCCGRFHGGVVEPDALSLMKARFSAYSLGVVPYVVRTTHPDNPDFEGAEKLAEDVRATCARLRFIKLDVVNCELSESEAFVSFVAHYSLLKGGRGERKQLKEKSHFVKEGGRWLFRETISLSQSSEAAWMAATIPAFVKPAGKSFAKSKAQVAAQQNKPGPRGF